MRLLNGAIEIVPAGTAHTVKIIHNKKGQTISTVKLLSIDIVASRSAKSASHVGYLP